MISKIDSLKRERTFTSSASSSEIDLWGHLAMSVRQELGLSESSRDEVCHEKLEETIVGLLW